LEGRLRDTRSMPQHRCRACVRRRGMRKQRLTRCGGRGDRRIATRHLLSSQEKTLPNLSMRSGAVPEARTTQVSGSSATNTGRPVSLASRRSRTPGSAPPPASMMLCPAISAPSSGGVCSSAILTADTIRFSGSVKASRISLLETVNLRGVPSDRLRPLHFHFLHFRAREYGADFLLDGFGGLLSDQHAVVRRI
jgi:hypothetical protein